MEVLQTQNIARLKAKDTGAPARETWVMIDIFTDADRFSLAKSIRTTRSNGAEETCCVCC